MIQHSRWVARTTGQKLSGLAFTLLLVAGAAAPELGCGSQGDGAGASGGAATGGMTPGGSGGSSTPGVGGAVEPTGGNASSGGTVGSGGQGTGGSTGQGGRTGAGATTGTGGAIGVGGAIGKGGTSGLGDASATGGTTSTAGTTGAGGARDAGLGGGTGARNGGAPGSGGNTTTIPCSSGSACIDFSNLQQEIDGYGASSAWHGNLSTAVLDAAFKNENNKQLGLSILRVDISPSGQSAWGSQKTNATNAKSRGVKYVLATPWSPPGSMKTNGGTVGGELKTDSYAAYATYLKSFYTYMGGAGGAVDIISVQNEPNISVSYDSATWSATQLFNFTKNNAQDIGAPYMMPETFNYDTSYSDSSLNDATAESHIAYIGLHLYGAKMKTYTLAVQKQKKIWMTEFYYNPEDIGTMMQMAKQIMDCMENQMNAYVWWYLVTPDCNLLTSSGGIRNKGYVMAQFSKYVRPGSRRVSATYQPQTSVNVQAFAGTSNVIIALNQNSSAKSQTFTISGANVTSLHQYTTSESKKLSDDGTVPVSNNSFTVSLDPKSVTTFVAGGAAP